MWAALLAAAVVVIVTVGNPTAGHSRASLETWTAVVAVLGPALVLCVLGAGIVKGPASAVLLALVSGALWGLFAVLTKGVVDRLDDGLWALLRTPELYVWARGRHRGHGLAAVVVPGRLADGVAADHDGRRAGRRLGARRRRAGRGAAPGRRGWFTLIVAVAVMVVATAALARGEAALRAGEAARVIAAG